MQHAERWFAGSFVLAIVLLTSAAAFGVAPDNASTLVILVVGVVLLGLPHGALDPLVARNAFANIPRYHTLSFYAAYLSAVCLYALLWRNLPTAGLAGFLIIAAYHFGSDWTSRGSALTRFGYGLTVVTLPAAFHPRAEAQIFTLLGTPYAPAFVSVSRLLAPLAMVAGGIGAILQCKQRKRDLVEFLAIVAGALLLEPLVFFTCYFSLLHSPRHLLETAQDLGLTDLASIVRKSLPILIATLALAGLFYLGLRGASATGRIVMTVFIGLAALTVPHMLLDALASASKKRSC
jgi:Brp/Blh family beta-carotene 15,15'-monooxygenase